MKPPPIEPIPFFVGFMWAIPVGAGIIFGLIVLIRWAIGG